jgi:hypothetical protein
VRDRGCFDDVDLLHSVAREALVVLQPDPGTQEHRDEVQFDLVQQPGRQVLPSDSAAARYRDVLAISGGARQLDRGVDPAGDELEAGASLAVQPRAREPTAAATTARSVPRVA